MSKLWKLQAEIPKNIEEKLSQYPKLLSQLLYNRGLVEKDKVDDFLNPKYENLHNPFLFRDMEKAVARIWQAIEQNQKITIYGDYDADAVTANAVLRQTFKYLNHDNVASYIPDRFTEGYGVNVEALEKIRDNGTKLIITVDCGTNSVDAADFCLKNNIDFIITDHHEIIGEKPKAYAIINPKNPDDNYPYQEITGVGVAFKLACGILNSDKRQETRDKRIEGWEKWLLDLVAIGTVADCHSLLGENRILVKYGLKVLQKTRWTGLRALVKSSGLDFVQKLPDAYALGFSLAPRLNAAGRLEHADAALSLLLEDDVNQATIKAQGLEEVNLRRQKITERILSEAREQALMLKDRKLLVLSSPDWHKGVVGLVAGKIAEEFYKPVIVLEKSADFATGSARTAGDFNIIEALKHGSEHLVRFGGHKQAAGLTVETVKIEIFYQKILDYAEINIAENSSPVLNFEAEIDESDLSLVTCDLLQQLEPFGVGNAKPKFLLLNAKLVSSREVGKLQNHKQMKLQVGNREVDGIMFNHNEFAKSLQTGDNLDIACEILADEWNGQKRIKLRIIDLRKSL